MEAHRPEPEESWQCRQFEEQKLQQMEIKCPECLKRVSQNELDTFGGLCEECSGAFDN